MPESSMSDLQHRFESDWVGQSLITGLILFILGALVFWNLPDSAITKFGVNRVSPAVLALGLDQRWGVFAPNPRSQVWDLQARIEYADGRVATWKFPALSDPILSEFRIYHWQKWTEVARSDDYKALAASTAMWVARTHLRYGAPARVLLIRRWYDLRPPGRGPSRGPWEQETYYTLDVTPQVLAKLKR